MGAESKNLVTISYVTDTDVSYYHIGEAEGSFQKEELKEFVKRFGHENLLAQLAFLQFQVWDVIRELNYEIDNDGVKYCDGVNKI